MDIEIYDEKKICTPRENMGVYFVHNLATDIQGAKKIASCAYFS